MRNFRLSVIRNRFYVLYDMEREESTGLLFPKLPRAVFGFEQYSRKFGVTGLGDMSLYKDELESLKDYAPLQEVVQVKEVLFYKWNATLAVDWDSLIGLEDWCPRDGKGEGFTASLYQVLERIYKEGWNDN